MIIYEVIGHKMELEKCILTEREISTFTAQIF